LKNQVHWIRQDMILNVGESKEYMVRTLQTTFKKRPYQFEIGMYISFEEPQSAITEGQFAAWYLDDELVGSGLFLSLVL
jgi:tRNA-specific 2-thiouridylase